MKKKSELDFNVATSLGENPREVAAITAAFIDEVRRAGTSAATLETAEKKGLPLGIDAVHPVSGERVPIYAANFVLMEYGAGAVMAVAVCSRPC